LRQKAHAGNGESTDTRDELIRNWEKTRGEHPDRGADP
jgi:hypothetical protein